MPWDVHTDDEEQRCSVMAMPPSSPLLLCVGGEGVDLAYGESTIRLSQRTARQSTIADHPANALQVDFPQEQRVRHECRAVDSGDVGTSGGQRRCRDLDRQVNPSGQPGRYLLLLRQLQRPLLCGTSHPPPPTKAMLRAAMCPQRKQVLHDLSERHLCRATSTTRACHDFVTGSGNAGDRLRRHRGSTPSATA